MLVLFYHKSFLGVGISGVFITFPMNIFYFGALYIYLIYLSKFSKKLMAAARPCRGEWRSFETEQERGVDARLGDVHT